VKGATLLAQAVDEPDAVSIHAPVKGATGGSAGGMFRVEFQSTRP